MTQSAQERLQEIREQANDTFPDDPRFYVTALEAEVTRLMEREAKAEALAAAAKELLAWSKSEIVTTPRIVQSALAQEIFAWAESALADWSGAEDARQN